MTVRVLAVFAVLSVTSVHAQEQPQPRNIDKLLVVDLKDAQQALEVPEPPDPPAGIAAWTLRVDTTGGFTGMGLGSVTIASDGQIACGPAPCATPIRAPLLEPVATTISSIIEQAWIRLSPSGICRDCMQTTITLKRRDAEGVRRYVASWDDSQPAAPELRELRRLAFELRATRTAR